MCKLMTRPRLPRGGRSPRVSATTASRASSEGRAERLQQSQEAPRQARQKFVVDIKLIDSVYFDVNTFRDSFLCKTALAATELTIFSSMVEAEFMRQLDLHVDPCNRIFGEGRGVYLHEPLAMPSEKLSAPPQQKDTKNISSEGSLGLPATELTSSSEGLVASAATSAAANSARGATPSAQIRGSDGSGSTPTTAPTDASAGVRTMS